jgi:serine/threonine-protein kinase HipA
MLERIGGECAGAVTFMPAGQPLTENHYRELSQKALVAILKELPKRPLLAGREGGRLTLAGAQDKLAVRITSGEVRLPLGDAPSTPPRCLHSCEAIRATVTETTLTDGWGHILPNAI